jgi:L-seryl-tRNA(Ser) seleniumtransferase
MRVGDNPFRNLPAINEVLQSDQVLKLRESFPHETIVDAIRQELANLRRDLGTTGLVNGELEIEAIAERVVNRLEESIQAKIRQIINATGIVLHTNLGRAPLAEKAAQAAYEAGRAYCNLEVDLETGQRSSRQLVVRHWICRLTGAESAAVVNNNAAATLIALRALCRNKEVIISRGQLIEIGGSFRIPEIMAVSGARLCEVGTTNITRLADYENSLSLQTGAILRVHTSNYRITGFTEAVTLPDLVALGRKHALPVIDDIGSGALTAYGAVGLAGEPVAAESIRAGADLVLFSGDKLLGGPQAGILAGRREHIQKIETDPLMRALRPDKMTLAALEATLQLYLCGPDQLAWASIPVLQMISVPSEKIRMRAERLMERLRAVPGLNEVQVQEVLSFAGGGSLPDQALTSWAIAIRANGISEAELARRLRLGTPGVMSRLQDGKVLLDLRTVFESQEPLLLEAIQTATQT